MKRIDIFQRVAIAATLLGGIVACDSTPRRVGTSFNLKFTSGNCDTTGQMIDSTVNGIQPGDEFELNKLIIRYNPKDKKLDTTTPENDRTMVYRGLRNDGDIVTYLVGNAINTVTLVSGDRKDIRLESFCQGPQ